MFVLKQRNAVVARAKSTTESNSGLHQWNIGQKMPPGLWNTDATTIIWSTKWALNGLMPVRPMVVFVADVDIPAGKAVVLAKTAM